jgi:hypothetical protein
MTSHRRRAANRRNAQRSTGPRSAEGKARAAANAQRHGLAAAAPGPERAAETARLAAAYRPLLGDVELAQRAAEAHVRLHRVKAAKLLVLRQAHAALMANEPAAPPAELEAGALLQAAPALRTLAEYERKARSRLKTTLRRAMPKL